MNDYNIEEIIKFTKNLKLLYVEDNKKAREETVDTLELFFDNIIVATDGEDGLNKYKNSKIDLIITDIKMPNLNGLELIKEIRKNDLDVAIIITSAYDEVDFFLESINLSIEAYLLKPFTENELCRVFEKIIKKIKIKNELQDYKENLEKKIQQALKEINEKNQYLYQQAKFVSMGEAINDIAYQWRQPLQIINSIVSSMELIILKNNINDQRLFKKLDDIEYNIKYMSEIMNDFLNFFEPNREKELFNIINTLNKAIQTLKPILMNINVTLDIKESQLFGYEKDYRQIVISILHHAIYLLEKSDVEKKEIKISSIKEKDYLILFILNNCGGIEEEMINELSNHNFKTKFKNQAISLYTSKIILQNNMNGNLKILNYKNGVLFKIEVQNIKSK